MNSNLAATREATLDVLFSAIDAKDPDGFLKFLTEDARFRFGSATAVTGRAAVREAVAGFFATIAGLRHTVTTVTSTANTLFCEGDVTYTRHDGSEISLPFVDVFEYEDDKIRDYKIYMDIGPLYAEHQAEG